MIPRIRPEPPRDADDEEEEGGARALLPEGPAPCGGHPWSWRGGGDRSGLAQPRGACVAGGRAGHQVGSLGNAS